MINFFKQIFDNNTNKGDKIIMRDLKGTNLVKVKNQKALAIVVPLATDLLNLLDHLCKILENHGVNHSF